MSEWSKSAKPVVTGIPAAEIFMVDEAEVAATPGIAQPGWVRRTTVGSRKKYETLVAMASASTDAVYEAAVGKTAGAFVIGTEYKILTAGNTDFTLIGAANSNVNTVFTASGVGTGTGTAVATSDDDDTEFADS
tara:strand:+ start:55 stop:456 length:402 start_codon:yes stop_codon:yes gene_type:complete